MSARRTAQPSRPIRAAMVILEYHPVLGGAQGQLRALIPLLRARGVEPQIVTRSAAGQPAFEVIEGTPVHRLPAPGPKALASAVFRSAALLKLRELRPDLIHAFSLFSPCEIAVMAKRRWGTPNIVKVLRGGALGDAVRLQRKPLAQRRIRALRRRVDRFASISHEISNELLELGVERSQLVRIPNGVDTGRFRPVPAERRAELRASLGLPGLERTLLVYSGRLVPEKRVDRLVDFFCAARREGKAMDVTLVVVGEGSERAALEARALDSARGAIRFVGAQSEVAPWLQCADAFALPSDSEGLSNAMLEAMACGLPSVVTRVGGASEVIEHGRNGLLVEPGDPAELAAALHPLLEGASERQRRELGAAARATIEREFSLVTTADRLATVYGELCAASRVAASTPVAAPLRSVG